MANILEIIANIHKVGGLSQTNRFVVMITAPTSLGDTRSLMYLCDTVNLPGMQFATQAIRHRGYGLQEQRPNAFTFSNLVCTFFIDNSGTTLSFFQRWAQLAFSFDPNQAREDTNGVSSENFNYPAEYWGTITVFFKDKIDSDIMVYEFDKVFPLDIGDVQLGWEQNDTIGRLPVSFAFRSYSTTATQFAATTQNLNTFTNPYVNLSEVNRVLTTANLPDELQKRNVQL